MSTTPNKPVREDLAKKIDPAVVSPEIMDLAAKSRTILGYKVIQKLVTKPKTLREALMDLDIAPFSKKSVELYKAAKQKKAQAKLKGDDRENVRWVSHNLSLYSGAVPESVLLRAIKIKESLPEVRFQIEQLNVEKPALPDPFLVASYNDERYFVDVWDEPVFEDKMLRGAHIQHEEDFDEDGD